MPSLAAQAWHMTIKAADETEREFGPLSWKTDLDIGGQGGVLFYTAPNLIFFRDPAITENHQTDYWVAWEPNKSVDKMERVRWDVDANRWFQWDVLLNTWAKQNDRRMEWKRNEDGYNFMPE
jgi:hypothetical protein